MYKPRHIQLTIPDPCGQDWENMKEDAGGKFCGQYSKKVIDFTTWTDAELYNYFYRRDEHVCGRFLSTQLDRNIRIPYQPHSKLYRIAVALGAALIFTQVPEARAHVRPHMVCSSSIINATDTTTGNLTGQIFDSKKEPVVNASITVKQNGNTKSVIISDFDGNYSIKGLEPGVYDVTFAFVGFDPKTITGVVVKPAETTLLNTVLASRHVNGPEIKMGGYRPLLVKPYGAIKQGPRTQTADPVTTTTNNAVHKVSAESTIKGTIYGIVQDDKKEPMVNVSVCAKQNGIAKIGSVTNFEGKYEIAGLDTGVYEITFSYIGFATKTVTGVPMNGQPLTLNMTLDHGRVIRCGVHPYRPPLIYPYEIKTVIHGSDIKHKPGW